MRDPQKSCSAPSLPVGPKAASESNNPLVKRVGSTKDALYNKLDNALQHSPPAPPKSSKDFLAKLRMTPVPDLRKETFPNSNPFPASSTLASAPNSLPRSPFSRPASLSDTPSFSFGSISVHRTPSSQCTKDSEITTAQICTIQHTNELPITGPVILEDERDFQMKTEPSTDQILVEGDSSNESLCMPLSSLCSSQTLASEASGSSTVDKPLKKKPVPAPRPPSKRTHETLISSQRNTSGETSSTRSNADRDGHLDDSSHNCLAPNSSPDQSCLMDASTLIRRLFNNPLFSDLEIRVNGSTFHVHRGILAEHCSHFRSLFEKARRQDPENAVNMIDCSYVSSSSSLIIDCQLSILNGVDQDPPKSTIPITKVDSSDQSSNIGLESCSQVAMLLSEAACDSSVVLPVHQGSAQDGTTTARTRTQAALEHSSCSTLNSVAPATFATGPAKMSFSSIFVMGEQTQGYDAHHFAVFLQILYGVLALEAIQDLDLLPVFRISYLYNVPGLTSALSLHILKTVVLSVSTWPSLLRFSERYRLQSIKQRALHYASRHREIWTLAVELLTLDDFKEVLRGIRPEDVVKSEPRVGLPTSEHSEAKAMRSRAVKDELLMMYLLVHYHSGIASSSSSSLDATLCRKKSVSSHMEGIARRLSMTWQMKGIQRPLHQQQQQQMNDCTSGLVVDAGEGSECSASKDMSDTARGGQQNDGAKMPIAGLPIRMDKAEKALSWMKQFKRECGWDGDVSHLS
ncbi:hypothetical protein EMPS_09377 [Entomortierella parvispora]|uniref:BTB domain-containing protein n=1 Tax=Entomortierella parvispora TaxID=205924 RepID=A0A9P3M087_9FUNG|nr:hypothetical protein EMPS_09377 [Entomortierella parvispora]